MKILILGAGNVQLNAIIKAKQKGHIVIVSDYYEDAPGKAYADYGEMVSTFDVKGNISVAKKYNIDGVMTIGTDQPVYTVANVAAALNLPAFIDVDTAKAVTNKKNMKELFLQKNIPTVKYRTIKNGFQDEELQGLKFPVVVKPLDSQGQRGVYKLNDIEEIRDVFDEVLSYSQEEEILVEEFYESDEITINGWVKEGNAHIVSVVDRITYNQGSHIGIAIRHNFPTKYMHDYFKEIAYITQKIVDCFNIYNGPIYFQMLIGKEGIKVNEIACRLGGAYEDHYLPKITGVDMLDMVIDGSLGMEIDFTALNSFQISNTTNRVSVEMFFARPCKISALNDMSKIRKLPGVIQARHNFAVGCKINAIENATQRAGYVVIEGENETKLTENIKRVYKHLGIYDEYGDNMLLRL